MPPTDPPEPTDSDLAPSSANKGGRPGVSHGQVVDAVDTWIARTGRAPSVRELRTALGETGSLSTLGRHLREVLAERLLAGESPDRGSPEEILIKSMKAAMGLLASEVAGAADDAIAEGAREADARIAAAEGLQIRARAQAEQAEKEREHALGRGSVLDDQLVSMKAELAEARQALADAQAGESNAKQIISERELSLQAARDERRQVEQAKTEQQQQLEDMTAELATIQQSWKSLQTTLTTITAERDAAHGTINGLQLVLDQAEKRVSTIRTDLTDTQADRDALRESLNQWKERHTAIEKRLLLAQASVEQANKERDARVTEQTQLEQIQVGLTALLSAIGTKP